MSKRVAIVQGIRTSFCKAGGPLRHLEADDLGAIVLQELLARSGVDPEKLDGVILGNVLQPSNKSSIARIAAVKGGVPHSVPGLTLNRNCASGMEAVISAAVRIQAGAGELYIAGGMESMSHFPILFPPLMREWLEGWKGSKTLGQKIGQLFRLRPSFFSPVLPSIRDPLCGLSMGQTAEKIIREAGVTRAEQDAFAVQSHNRAERATKEGRFAKEIVPVPLPPEYKAVQKVDSGIREGQKIEQLAKLPPVFDKLVGSVTAATSSQVTDGAVALLVASEEACEKWGLQPLGWLKGHATVGLDPSRMGLGPALAIPKLLEKEGSQLSDYGLFEINEAFAGQVLAVLKRVPISQEQLNVNGGAVALGHPLGASGARLILTLLLEMQQRGVSRGIASLCVGGGQGQAVALEKA